MLYVLLPGMVCMYWNSTIPIVDRCNDWRYSSQTRGVERKKERSKERKKETHTINIYLIYTDRICMILLVTTGIDISYWLLSVTTGYYWLQSVTTGNDRILTGNDRRRSVTGSNGIY